MNNPPPAGGGISAEFEKRIGITVEIAAAPGQFRAGGEGDAIFAVKPGMQVANACDIDDLRAVGAEEFRRNQLFIETFDRAAQQKRVTADAKVDIIPGPFEPVNFFNP